MSARFAAAELRECASAVLERVGCAPAIAATCARVLVMGDLLGHDTHGLALLAPYVAELEAGRMRPVGTPETLSDRGASLLWDGARLPGPWLVERGLAALMPRARQFGTATLVIRRSHHIACLAAYLQEATAAGFMIVLASSDPAVASVAPFGGTRGVMTPNPIAAGLPTSGEPILVDISASVTTNSMTARLRDQGRTFATDCLLDAAGEPSCDPAVLFADPPGTIQPLGGLLHGHKGFGLALIVEALTGGLAGFGRADAPEGWGATVSLSLYDPDAFGSAAAYRRQMDALVAACLASPARSAGQPVRLPGQRALARLKEQEEHGVTLLPAIGQGLLALAARLGVAPPCPLAVA